MKNLLILSLILNVIAILCMNGLAREINKHKLEQSQMWKYQLYIDAKLSGQIEEND